MTSRRAERVAVSLDCLRAHRGFAMASPARSNVLLFAWGKKPRFARVPSREGPLALEDEVDQSHGAFAEKLGEGGAVGQPQEMEG